MRFAVVSGRSTSEAEETTMYTASRRRWAQWVAGAMVVVLGAGACGSDGDSPIADAVTTTTASVTTAPPTTAAPVSWADADEIADNSPEQVLPTLTELIAVLDAENARLGATDALGYDEEDQALRAALEDGPCARLAFASFFYDANVGLTERPSVGILGPSITAFVCDDDAAVADRAEFAFGIADLDQGPCPVDDLDAAGLGIRICPLQPGDELKGWKGAALGVTDRVLVSINTELGPQTDADDAAASLTVLLDTILAHVDQRLG